jgi:hypothetical protein
MSALRLHTLVGYTSYENGILDLDFYVLEDNLKGPGTFQMLFEQFVHLILFGPYPFYNDGYKLVEVPYLAWSIKAR